MIISVGEGAPFVKALLRLKEFEDAPFTSGHPGGFYDATTASIQGSEDRLRMRTLTTDENLLSSMSLTLAEGRFFSADFPADSMSSVVLNETAVYQLGWENQDAIGRQVMMAQFDSTYRTVVGIVKDYHFTSLKEKIEPFIISYDNGRGNLLVRISGTDIRVAVAGLEKVWSSFNSAYPLDFSFVDDVIDQLSSEAWVCSYWRC